MEFFLFVFGLAGSLLLCGAFLQLSAQASYCWGFSCCRARALGPLASVLVVPGLYAALQSTGSAIVVDGFSCSVACGIFPDQGWNPCLLHWQADSLPWATREAPPCFIIMKTYKPCFQEWILQVIFQQMNESSYKNVCCVAITATHTGHREMTGYINNIPSKETAEQRYRNLRQTTIKLYVLIYSFYQ